MPSIINHQPNSYAQISEVFASVQGEGPWVGTRQIFVRFCGCNLDCAFCDAPEAKTATGTCRIETAPGSWSFLDRSDRFDVEGLMDVVRGYGPAKLYHSVAVTGGEPLLHAAFLALWFSRLRAEAYRTYLETNGVLHKQMSALASQVDYCSMDIKLPSTSGQPADWLANRAFLSACREAGIQTYVKAVVGKHTSTNEVQTVARLIAEEWPQTLLVLQPVTPYGAVQEGPEVAHTLELQHIALDILRDVRVIPQTHKMLGAL